MSEEIAALLREIRDQQRLQVERQGEALALQKKQFERYESQMGRVEHINERAEAIQRRAGKAMKVVLWVALPLVFLVLATMLWPWLRYLAYRFA
jgi:parvulin-like peptidyl-prolyl isomerase